MTKIEVAPLSMPMTNTLRVERTTAFATFGLATKTSFASRGRSMMSERPMERSSLRATACSSVATATTPAASDPRRPLARDGATDPTSNAMAAAECTSFERAIISRAPAVGCRSG
jgi:hypothetical protein